MVIGTLLVLLHVSSFEMACSNVFRSAAVAFAHPEGVPISNTPKADDRQHPVSSSNKVVDLGWNVTALH